MILPMTRSAFGRERHQRVKGAPAKYKRTEIKNQGVIEEPEPNFCKLFLKGTNIDLVKTSLNEIIDSETPWWLFSNSSKKGNDN